MRKLVFLIVIFFSVTTVEAQLEVGFFGGTSYYMGDINPSTPFLKSDLAYGFLARYNLSSRWSAKINLYHGVLKGDDSDGNFLPERNLSFTSSVNELAGMMEFNFLPYFNGSMKNYWTPYLFAGVGVLNHRPQRDGNDLRDYGTEGQGNTNNLIPPDTERPEYSYFVFSIPFGMGVKYSFSEKIAASLEWGMRKTYSDYLDDVSTTYYTSIDLVDPDSEEYEALLISDPDLSHDPNMQRGNSKTNDWYSFAGITITYYIDLRNRNKCSDFENRN